MDSQKNATEQNVQGFKPYIDHSVAIRNGMYGKWEYSKKTESTTFIPMGSAVYLEKVIVNAETLDRVMQLYFLDAHGERVSFSLPREKLTEQGISEFTRKGVQVTKKNISVLLATIFNQEKDVPCEMHHTELGFAIYQNQKVFYGAKGVNVPSSYNGQLAIQQTGDFNAWKTMVQTEVIGTNMELILAMASAAPIIDFYKDDLHTGNLLISLVGESSTGKTTAGCLAVSLGAKCSFSGDSMVATFADSKNSLMRSIYSSFPMLIDEGSLIRFNPTSMLYELAEGRERNRLTKDLTKAESRRFSTAIFMTSEKSLLNLCDENTGLYVRCMEFENITWTKSAESADKIKSVCEQNYGFVIELLVKKLLGLHKCNKSQTVVDKFKEFQQELVKYQRDKDRYTALTERICKMAALVVLGAYFFSDVTGIKLDSIEMGKRMLDNTAASDGERLDIGNRALDYICQYVAVNRAKFVLKRATETDTPISPLDCKGRIQTFSARMTENGQHITAELFLPEIVFEEILQKGGFPDKKVVLKKLKDMGVLHSDKDRYISKFVVLSPPLVKGYRIYIPADKTSLISPQSKEEEQTNQGWEDVAEDCPFPENGEKEKTESIQENSSHDGLDEEKQKDEDIKSSEKVSQYAELTKQWEKDFEKFPDQDEVEWDAYFAEGGNE